jgi:hypothetical protein
MKIVGTIKLHDSLNKTNKLWDLQVNHQLFALAKVSVTDCASDEIVSCAWDGMTYIVDQHLNFVRFQFPDRVCAFTAGKDRSPRSPPTI